MSMNVLIADDEFFIRQRIKKIIPWTSLNLRFAAEAENGQEVIQIVDSQPIDILILDIKMPKLDGIAVAEYLHSRHPLVKIIILSGYNDFEYARSAMRYGVSEYLLKPVDESLLSSTLSDCIRSLQRSRRQQEQMKKYYHYELCSLLHQILLGSSDIEELYSRYERFKGFTQTQFLGIYGNEWTEESLRSLTYDLRNALISCEYEQQGEYLYMLQFFYTHGPTPQEKILEILHKAIKNRPGFLFFSLGTVLSMEEPWFSSHKQVASGLEMRYFADDSGLISSYTPVVGKIDAPELSKIRHKIILSLNSQNEEGLKAIADSLFENILEKKSVNYMRTVILELFMTFHLSHPIPDFSATSLPRLMDSLLDEEYRLEELKNAVISYGLQCMDHNKSLPSDVSLSKRLMKYIQEHYTEPDLSIARIAEDFSLNASYIGTAFKKANSISILQYITNVRLEASLHLLKENRYKISEIAEMVGYSDVFYFSKRFKTAYGCPPKNYVQHTGE